LTSVIIDNVGCEVELDSKGAKDVAIVDIIVRNVVISNIKALILVT